MFYENIKIFELSLLVLHPALCAVAALTTDAVLLFSCYR